MLIELIALLVGYYVLWTIYRHFIVKDLTGQIVLVTGGGSGLGRRLALTLAKRGCKLVLWDINQEGLSKVVKEIEAEGGKAWGYQCNVMSYQAVVEVANRVKKEVGKVDVLINNAGIVSGKFLVDLTEEHITRTFGVNTLSHFWTMKEFLPDMIKTDKGHVVTIASASAISATAGLVDYSASKYAAFGANEALRLELRKQRVWGVHTLAVCPFYINTGMFDGVKTRFAFILPILEEKYACDRIVDSIVHMDAVLVMPFICRLPWLAKFALPVAFSDWFLEFMGVTDSMSDFKGRGWHVTNPNQKKNE